MARSCFTVALACGEALVSRVLRMVAVCCLLCVQGMVFAAPVPLAMWDEDFSTATKGGVTLSLNGNLLAADGKGVIIDSIAGGGKGVTLDWSATPRGVVTVCVKYAGFRPPAAGWGSLGVFHSVYDGVNESDHPGVAVGVGAGTMGVWESGAWTSGNGQTCGTFAGGSGVFALEYVPTSAGTMLLQRQGQNWMTVYACSGLRATTEKLGTAENGILGAAVGGLYASTYAVEALDGLEVRSIAVFDWALSAAELGEFLFPSQRKRGRATLTAAGSPYKWSELVWEGIVPTTTDDSAEIVVEEDGVELQMDVSSGELLSVVVRGTGALRLTGEGLLTGKSFATEVAVAWPTATGDLTLAPGRQEGNFVSLGNGRIAAKGVMSSPGLSGTGGLTISEGVFELRGDETFTGVTMIEEGAYVVTTNGSIGSGGLAGAGTACFRGAVPNAHEQTVFRDASWTGTCRLERIVARQEDFDANAYGNAGSKVCLAGVQGWLPSNGTCVPEVVLARCALDGTELAEKALELTDGYGQGDYTFMKLSGDGWLWDAHTSQKVKQILRVADISDFRGSVFMRVKRLVVGLETVAPETHGTIYIPTDVVCCAVGDATCDFGGSWVAVNGLYLDGELSIYSMKHLTRDSIWTTVHVGKTGTLRMVMTPPFDTGDYNTRLDDYSRIVGEGRILFTDIGTETVRGLPDKIERMWSNTLSVVNEQGTGTKSGMIVCVRGTAEEPAVMEIGTLSGAGPLRSDANDQGQGQEDRNLRIIQRVDSTWSGVIVGGRDNLASFVVAGDPGATSKTLTLTGVNTLHRDRLVIEETGSVCLNGVWNGDVTVAGEFGGCGTNTNGTVTFADGAVIDARKGVFHAAALGAWPATLEVLLDDGPQVKDALLIASSQIAEGMKNVRVTAVLPDGRRRMCGLTALPGGVRLLPPGLTMIIR